MQKKILHTMAVIIVLLLLAVAPAHAVLMEFDDYLAETQINGVHLGTSPDGVTITSPSGDVRVIVSPSYGVGYRSALNAVTNFNEFGSGDYLTNIPLVLTFDVPRGFVAFTGGDMGGDLDQFTVTAYDINNNVLGSITTPFFGGNPMSPDGIMVDFYRVTFDRTVLNWDYMKKVVISDAINFGIGIDDLEFCQPVPIPGSLLLLFSGMIPLLRFRRKN